MRLKLMDVVYHPDSNLSGQIIKIRHNVATIQFVTGEKIKKNLNKINYVNNQWITNGYTPTDSKQFDSNQFF